MVEEEKLATPLKVVEITELTMTALRLMSMRIVTVGAVCMDAKLKPCLSPSTVSFIFSRIASRSSTRVAQTLSKGFVFISAMLVMFFTYYSWVKMF